MAEGFPKATGKNAAGFQSVHNGIIGSEPKVFGYMSGC